MLKEFKTFIMRGNVVDLAVAVIIGAAFGAVIASFVDNIINPIIGLLGGADFSDLVITLDRNDPGPQDDVNLRWGAVVTTVINFVMVAAAIFFIIVKPLNYLNEKRKRGELEPEDVPAPTDEALLLAEIRDLLQAQSR
jgi:large conductance mechanosensitive channel